MSSVNTNASLLPGFKLKLVNPGQIDINSISQSEVSQSDISQISIMNALSVPTRAHQVGQGIVDYVSSESDIEFDMDLTFSDSE